MAEPSEIVNFVLDGYTCSMDDVQLDPITVRGAESVVSLSVCVVCRSHVDTRLTA